MKLFRTINMALATVGIALSGQASAEFYMPNVTVNRLLIAEDGRYGNCMANLSQPVGNGCMGNWVTFSCTGDFNDAQTSWRMYDQAQMAYAMGSTVSVHIEETQRHNGFCVVKQLKLD